MNLSTMRRVKLFLSKLHTLIAHSIYKQEKFCLIDELTIYTELCFVCAILISRRKGMYFSCRLELPFNKIFNMN